MDELREIQEESTPFLLQKAVELVSALEGRAGEVEGRSVLVKKDTFTLSESEVSRLNIPYLRGNNIKQIPATRYELKIVKNENTLELTVQVLDLSTYSRSTAGSINDLIGGLRQLRSITGTNELNLLSRDGDEFVFDTSIEGHERELLMKLNQLLAKIATQQKQAIEEEKAVMKGAVEMQKQEIRKNLMDILG